MEYLDENGKPIDFNEINTSLNQLGNEIPSEEEIILNLEEAYQQGNKSVTGLDVSFVGRGREIWREIKKFVCERIDEETEQEKFAEIIAEALSKVLPGGGIVKIILKKIVRFLIGKGVSAVCNF